MLSSNKLGISNNILLFYKALVRTELHSANIRVFPMSIMPVNAKSGSFHRVSQDYTPNILRKEKKKKQEVLKPSKRRTYFPETWLWKLNLLGFVFVKKIFTNMKILTFTNVFGTHLILKLNELFLIYN